jgi:hypothetical protein
MSNFRWRSRLRRLFSRTALRLPHIKRSVAQGGSIRPVTLDGAEGGERVPSPNKKAPSLVGDGASRTAPRAGLEPVAVTPSFLVHEGMTTNWQRGTDKGTGRKRSGKSL